MMMTMSQSTSLNKPFTDPDIDWSVFENADRYLLRDDSAWITRLGKDFWWNLDRISEMITTTGASSTQLKTYSEEQTLTKTSNVSTRKIVGQRSTISRPNPLNIPSRITANQDSEYNPFQSNVSFDNHIWTNFFQQAIPWQ